MIFRSQNVCLLALLLILQPCFWAYGNPDRKNEWVDTIQRGGFWMKKALHFTRLVTLLALVSAMVLSPQSYAGSAVTVDWETNYQTIDGFGVSEAFHQANNITLLGTTKQQEIYELLFSTSKGAGFFHLSFHSRGWRCLGQCHRRPQQDHAAVRNGMGLDGIQRRPDTDDSSHPKTIWN